MDYFEKGQLKDSEREIQTKKGVESELEKLQA